MKKMLIVAAVVAMASCNSKTDSKTESTMGADSTKVADVKYPYEILNSSKFEMADPKYGQMVLELWKDWDNGNLSNHKDYFADSVEMNFADGSSIHSVRDSVTTSAQAYRNSFAKAESRVFSITALRSIDKDENWGLVWGMEIDTDKKGKVDSFYLQEAWRFNKAGKTDLMYQYKQNAPPPAKK
jgi:hypothetical protein